jgi:hypothetical protein
MGGRTAYSRVHTVPHVFVTSHGARGASQQLPYPPGWRGDIINVTKNSKKIIKNKYKISKLQMTRNGNFNCR